MLIVLFSKLVFAGDSNQFLNKSIEQKSPKIALRMGFDASLESVNSLESPLPYVCGQAYASSRFSVEACGNGSGFLHQKDAPDTAHFRARYSVIQRGVQRSDWAVDVGTGIAEYQLGADKLGFSFGKAERGQREAAGPEATLSLTGRRWLSEIGYGTMDVTVGGAYVAGAPVVLGGSVFQQFGSISFGVGF